MAYCGGRGPVPIRDTHGVSGSAESTAPLGAPPGEPLLTKAKLLELLNTVQDETGAGESPEADAQGPAVTGLLASVEQLEASHPEIAGLINQVAITLSGFSEIEVMPSSTSHCAKSG